MLDEVGIREIRMSTSQQFDGRWLVYYVRNGSVEIQGLASKEQAIAYIATKTPGEFARYIYVANH